MRWPRCSSGCPAARRACASRRSAGRPRRCCASAAGRWTWCRMTPARPALVAAFAAQWTPADAGVKILFPASSRALPTIAAGLTPARRRGHAGRGLPHRSRRARRRRLPRLDRARRHRRGDVRQSLGGRRARARLGAEDFERLLTDAAAVAIGRTTAHELASPGTRRWWPNRPPCTGWPSPLFACCKRERRPLWDFRDKDRGARAPVGCLAAHGARDAPQSRHAHLSAVRRAGTRRAPPGGEHAGHLSAVGGRGR